MSEIQDQGEKYKRRVVLCVKEYCKGLISYECKSEPHDISEYCVKHCNIQGHSHCTFHMCDKTSKSLCEETLMCSAHCEMIGHGHCIKFACSEAEMNDSEEKFLSVCVKCSKCFLFQ